METINGPSFMNSGLYRAIGVRHFKSSNLISVAEVGYQSFTPHSINRRYSISVHIFSVFCVVYRRISFRLQPQSCPHWDSWRNFQLVFKNRPHIPSFRFFRIHDYAVFRRHVFKFCSPQRVVKFLKCWGESQNLLLQYKKWTYEKSHRINVGNVPRKYITFRLFTWSEFHIILIHITSICLAPQNKTTPTKRTFKCVTIHVY